MGVTKTSLRDFMDNRFKKARNEVFKEIDKYYNEKIEPLLDAKLSVLDKQMKQVSKVSDEFVKFQRENILLSYDYSRYVRDLNIFVNVKSDTKTRELSKIKTAVQNDSLYEKFGISEEVENAKTELRPVHGKINDIYKLENEVTTVINNASSGKKAYGDLKTLGIDMSDYKEENANLPSIQKFSVDTCLVNGDCN